MLVASFPILPVCQVAVTFLELRRCSSARSDQFGRVQDGEPVGLAKERPPHVEEVVPEVAVRLPVERASQLEGCPKL